MMRIFGRVSLPLRSTRNASYWWEAVAERPWGPNCLFSSTTWVAYSSIGPSPPSFPPCLILPSTGPPLLGIYTLAAGWWGMLVGTLISQEAQADSWWVRWVDLLDIYCWKGRVDRKMALFACWLARLFAFLLLVILACPGAVLFSLWSQRLNSFIYCERKKREIERIGLLLLYSSEYSQSLCIFIR